jgi:spore coat protein CotF
MAMFINQVKDPELKAIIQRQYSAHIQDYNIKVEYLSKPEGTTMKLQVPPLGNNLPNYTWSGIAPEPVTPRTEVNQFEDREIAASYLLTLKRAGREYAWAAMEASNPGIRAFLEDAFTMTSHHAFEIWQWMVMKGYYALLPASQIETNNFSNMYHTVQEPVLMMR